MIVTDSLRRKAAYYVRHGTGSRFADEFGFSRKDAQRILAEAGAAIAQHEEERVSLQKSEDEERRKKKRAAALGKLRAAAVLQARGKSVEEASRIIYNSPKGYVCARHYYRDEWQKIKAEVMKCYGRKSSVPGSGSQAKLRQK